ncbi:hypothetical protein Tco_1390345, partial [Tanacetum coccineum]
VESTDDEDSDEENQGANVEGDKQDEEEINEKTNVQPTQVTEDTHLIIIALVNLEGTDSIFNLNNESTSLVDLLVTAIAEPPLLFVTTTPPPS